MLRKRWADRADLSRCSLRSCRGGHDDCFLIVDRVGQDFVVGIRAHTGEVATVYLMDVDIEKLVKFLSQKCVTDTDVSAPGEAYR
jgi:hypothetical protein